MGATRDQMNKAAVAQLVTIRTQTDGQPTSTSLPLSPTEVDQPVRSIAEYMLAREKIRWKKEYEYVTGFDFSSSSWCSSALSRGSNGFPEPSNKENHKSDSHSLKLRHGRKINKIKTIFNKNNSNNTNNNNIDNNPHGNPYYQSKFLEKNVLYRKNTLKPILLEQFLQLSEIKTSLTVRDVCKVEFFYVHFQLPGCGKYLLDLYYKQQ